LYLVIEQRILSGVSPCIFISKMVYLQIVVVDHADVISMQVNFKAYIFFYLFGGNLLQTTVYAWM
jgi:hypothetical protein